MLVSHQDHVVRIRYTAFLLRQVNKFIYCILNILFCLVKGEDNVRGEVLTEFTCPRKAAASLPTTVAGSQRVSFKDRWRSLSAGEALSDCMSADKFNTHLTVSNFHTTELHHYFGKLACCCCIDIS